MAVLAILLGVSVWLVIRVSFFPTTLHGTIGTALFDLMILLIVCPFLGDSPLATETDVGWLVPFALALSSVCMLSIAVLRVI